MKRGFPDILLNAYWHTTSIENYQSILECGNILPESSNFDHRWAEGLGSSHYPFVRTLGGVSIFDFHGFDPQDYSKKFPLSSWHVFVPSQRDTNSAIWIKLLPERMPGEFINGLELKKLQEDKNALRNRLMPRIECAHIGPIPLSSFIEVIRYDKSNGFTKLMKEKT